MGRTRAKAKGRRESGAFIPLPVSVLNHANFARLTPKAVKLLIDLCVQLRFREGGTVNNGDITAAWKLMEPRGWQSKDTLYRALDELLHYGFVIRTRQGGRNLCSLFAVTWWAIDECAGKLDIKPTRAPSNEWRNECELWNPKLKLKPVPRQSGQRCPSHRANGEEREGTKGLKTAQLARPSGQ